MTTKDAILKLADAVSGNTSANVATDVQALAVLAQAMTGGAPAEPLATVDDAIGYIADNYSGGGGGGVDVGALALVAAEGSAVPTVGGTPDLDAIVDVVKVGDAKISEAGTNGALMMVAAGASVATVGIPAEYVDTAEAYVCTADAGWTEYQTVVQWDGTITRVGTTVLDDAPGYYWTFTMPELQDGELFVLWVYLAS